MRFIDDYVKDGFTVEKAGTFYQMHGLKVAASEIEDAGNRAAVRFARDSRGFPDGIELLKLVPKAAAQKCVRCDGPAIAFGFCGECNAEMNRDIALDDVERPAPLPRPYYGNVVDPFGKDAA